MKIEHKKLGVDLELKDLRQRDLENYFARLREEQIDAEKLSLPEYAGAIVRIANDLGWFDIGNIDEMKPAAVIWLQRQIMNKIIEELTIPPE